MSESSPPHDHARDDSVPAGASASAAGTQPTVSPTTAPAAPELRPAPRVALWRTSVREFLIIVAGVLAALGAQAAWEYFQERELERVYLEQLVHDARENARRLDEAIASDSAGVAAAARLLTALEHDTPGVPADSIVSWIASVGSASDFQPVTGTHRALLETGDLRVLRNDSVRAALVAYATALDRGTQRLEQLRGSVLDLIPHMARELPFMRLLFAEGIAVSRVDVAALQANEEASVVLFAMQASSENRINGLRRMREATRELLSVLDRAWRTMPEPARDDSVNR